jgi:hypothetical protein
VWLQVKTQDIVKVKLKYKFLKRVFQALEVIPQGLACNPGGRAISLLFLRSLSVFLSAHCAPIAELALARSDSVNFRGSIRSRKTTKAREPLRKTARPPWNLERSSS